jgi:hypothetical protein
MIEYVAFEWHASTADTRVVPVVDRHTGQIAGCGYITTYAPPKEALRVKASFSVGAAVVSGSPRRFL